MPTKKKKQNLSKNIKLIFYQRKRNTKQNQKTEQIFKLLPPGFCNEEN